MILQSAGSISKYLYIKSVVLIKEKVRLSSRDLTKSFKMLETVNIEEKLFVFTLNSLLPCL